MLNAFTVDLEDYYHPEELQSAVPRPEWARQAARIESSTQRMLDLLSEQNVHATFFVLGWVARQQPALIRQVAGCGHEIACHGYWHRLVYELTPREFRQDTLDAMKAIEDACGVTPRSYRAPSYSIRRASMWALDVLCELGFTTDSSIYPIAHDRYGIPGFSRHRTRIQTPSGSILEVPPATVVLGAGRVAPCGGGGYLRLLPYRYTAAGLRRVNGEEQQPACVYVHPWELDCGQPRLAEGLVARMRTYAGLGGMEGKIRRLLRDFRFCPLTQLPEPQ